MSALKQRVAAIYPNRKVTGPVEVRRRGRPHIVVFHAGESTIVFQFGNPAKLAAAIDALKSNPPKAARKFSARAALKDERNRRWPR